MKTKSFFSIVLLFLCNFSIFSQIVFYSPEDAVKFARQNAVEKTLERELIYADMKKSAFSIKDFLPQLGLSLSDSDSISMHSPDSRTKSIQFSLTQTVLDGSRKIAYDLSNMQAIYAYKENEQAMQQFDSEIMSYYYNCLLAYSRLKIKNDLLQNTQAQVDIMQKQYLLGMVLETDYLEILTSALKIQNERDTAARTCRIQERILKLAAGIEETVPLELAEPLKPAADKQVLEPYIEQIWGIVKSKNIDLQKQDLTVLYARKQQQISNAWFLPVITAKPSVSFSGEDYPLSSPRYAIQLSFSFSNIPYFPVTISNTYNADQKRLTGVTNSGNTTFPSSTTYITDRRRAALSLLQQQVKRHNSERELYASLYEQIITHDDYIRTIEITTQTEDLQKRRLIFSKFETDKGTMKRIDYLKQMIELSNTQISLFEALTSFLASERLLSILTRIPFEELLNVCQ